jgi:hypothetical protein
VCVCVSVYVSVCVCACEGGGGCGKVHAKSYVTCNGSFNASPSLKSTMMPGLSHDTDTRGTAADNTEKIFSTRRCVWGMERIGCHYVKVGLCIRVCVCVCVCVCACVRSRVVVVVVVVVQRELQCKSTIEIHNDARAFSRR